VGADDGADRGRSGGGAQVTTHRRLCSPENARGGRAATPIGSGRPGKGVERRGEPRVVVGREMDHPPKARAGSGRSESTHRGEVGRNGIPPRSTGGGSATGGLPIHPTARDGGVGPVRSNGPIPIPIPIPISISISILPWPRLRLASLYGRSTEARITNFPCPGCGVGIAWETSWFGAGHMPPETDERNGSAVGKELPAYITG